MLPVVSLTESNRWQAIEAALPGFFEDLYRQWAEPVLRVSYPGRSGIFLTPTYFRLIHGSQLSNRARVVVPLDRIDATWSRLTYAGDHPRTSVRISADTLADAARGWLADDVRSMVRPGQDQDVFCTCRSW